MKRLKYLQATGRVVSLERGLYATVRPGEDPEAVSPDPFLAAAALRPDGLFAYHSALTLLGAGHSDWNVASASSASWVASKNSSPPPRASHRSTLSS